MAGSVNKVILVGDYTSGMSLPQVAAKHKLSISTARYHIHKAGVLRSRAEGVGLAASEGRLGSGLRGKRRVFSAAWRKNISTSCLSRADKFAKGVSLKPNGYLEYTRGKNKGKSVHVVTMEERLGRKLRRDEVVHHIDGNKTNNDISNLALLTRGGHARLHQREDKIMGKNRERYEDGRFR